MVADLTSQAEGLEACLRDALSDHPDRSAIVAKGEKAALQARVVQLETEHGQFELAQQRVRTLERDKTDLNRRIQTLRASLSREENEVTRLRNLPSAAPSIQSPQAAPSYCSIL